jgi:hypothetical protein
METAKLIWHDVLKSRYFKRKNDKRKYHVVGLIENSDSVIIKYYGLHHQWWHFEIENLMYLEMATESGTIIWK